MDQGSRAQVNGAARSRKGQKQFVAPTVEQVVAYCHDRGLAMDPAAFVDHYEANGWKVGGRAAMRDWQAAARNWARREQNYAQRNGSPARSKNPQTASKRVKEWKANNGR